MICERITVGAGTDYPLHGMLTFPDSLSKPVPAVALVHGSGPSDMDETVMKLTPFKDLAQGLAERGIASLRYDKRSFAVKEETIDDALLAAEVLKNDPHINRDRVFLLGHSMGAMLAPRIDAEGADVKGLILMAGTPYRLEEVVLRQLKQANGSNPLLNWFVGQEYRVMAKKFSGLYRMSDDEAKKKKFAGNLSLYYFKEMGQKTAVDYLLESVKPVLILQGGRDFQVLAEDDYRRFQELLSGRENIRFRLYPELNHAFVEAIYDDILKASREYRVERHIGETVIGDIASFILDS